MPEKKTEFTSTLLYWAICGSSPQKPGLKIFEAPFKKKTRFWGKPSILAPARREIGKKFF